MKIIKNIYLIGLLISLIAFNACQEDALIEPSPSPKVPDGTFGVYFPSVPAFELEPTDEKKFELTIARKDSTNAVTVPITVEVNDDEIFDIPSTVNFEAGEGKKEFVVSFPEADEGVTYNLKISVVGEEFVNPYNKELSYLTTSLTRVAWVPVGEPLVYIDATISDFFSTPLLPMYVEADTARVGTVLRYRLKNAFKTPTGEWISDDEHESTPDDNGIYDGFPFNYPAKDGEPADFDESNDYYTTIEIEVDENGEFGDVFMHAGDIGVNWGYGMFNIGSVYGNLSTDIDAYPLGTIEEGIITFPGNSLYVSMANYNGGGKYPVAKASTIYLSKEIFIAANSKITDFNEVEYEEIDEEPRIFISEAFGSVDKDGKVTPKVWDQTIEKAIDTDPQNEESEYKNLFFLPNLFNEGHGLAFYYVNDEIIVASNQLTGDKLYGRDIYVSASETIFSSVEEGEDGTIESYIFGLKFHYKDGTNLGEFKEIFTFYKEPEKEDFIGSFVLSGPSQFNGENPAEMNVEIAEGDAANELIITGVDFAEQIIATFDAENAIMSISPQELADLEHPQIGVLDIKLYTTDLEGDVSDTASMDFTIDFQGNIVPTESSEADGYLLYSDAVEDFIDGYYDLVFTPSAKTKSSNTKLASTRSTPKLSVKNSIVKRAPSKNKGHNFKVQPKRSLKNNNLSPIL